MTSTAVVSWLVTPCLLGGALLGGIGILAWIISLFSGNETIRLLAWRCLMVGSILFLIGAGSCVSTINLRGMH